MRTRQVTQREGERMGDIDYSFDFRSRYESYCMPKENRDEYCAKGINLLREIERRFKNKEHLQVRIGEYWHDLYDVGMYDGWPYWSPTPAVFTHGTLGGEWHFWYDLTAIRKQGSNNYNGEPI